MSHYAIVGMLAATTEYDAGQYRDVCASDPVRKTCGLVKYK